MKPAGLAAVVGPFFGLAAVGGPSGQFVGVGRFFVGLAWSSSGELGTLGPPAGLGVQVIPLFFEETVSPRFSTISTSSSASRIWLEAMRASALESSKRALSNDTSCEGCRVVTKILWYAVW